MGNLLCLPKKRKKSDSESSKKQRKGSSKKSRKVDCNQHVEKEGAASLNERLSEEVTAKAQASIIKEVPLITVRVIQVQGINDILSHESVHKENTEENCAIEELKSTKKRVQDEVQIVRTKPFKLNESNKTPKPSTPLVDSNELDSKEQKNVGKQTCSETKEHLTRNKSDECKTNKNCMDDTFVTKQVKVDLPVDKEKVKQSRFIVEKVLEKNPPDVDVNNVTEDDKIKREEEHTKETRTTKDPEKMEGDQVIDKTEAMIDKRIGLQNFQSIAVEPIEAYGETRELIETDDKRLVASTSTIKGKVLPKSTFEIKATNGIADVETTIKEINIKGAISCPNVAKNRLISSYIDKCDALLNVLSTLQTPQESTKSDPGVPASTNRRLVFGPQSESSDKHGVYKSKQGIENWINNAGPGTSSSPAKDESKTSVTSTSYKKVSDFNVPWKPRKLPPKPLPLKKPSSHLYKIPDLAKSNSDDDKVNWTQLEPKGPQTAVLWTTKPSAFDVKLPPLPKRLLERKGSVEKLQESWIIPQVKQIETLKREHGRFPGLVVPTALRNKYSVDIQKETETKETETINEDINC